MVTGLEMLIAGYSLAVRHHRLEDRGWESYAGFSDYLRDRFGWSMSRAPISAIRDSVATDKEAWDLFWQLLEEFRHAQ
ncbi:MAG TPA: hypothetical protein VER96_10380 [Polyangiaceae bacterium]|nr:hypothetical protein [Polyangiaceae bacterium]